MEGHGGQHGEMMELEGWRKDRGINGDGWIDKEMDEREREGWKKKEGKTEERRITKEKSILPSFIRLFSNG